MDPKEKLATDLWFHGSEDKSFSRESEIVFSAAPTPKQSNPINATSDVLNKQRHHSLSSSSEEAEDAHQTSINGWQ